MIDADKDTSLSYSTKSLDKAPTSAKQCGSYTTTLK